MAPAGTRWCLGLAVAVAVAVVTVTAAVSSPPTPPFAKLVPPITYTSPTLTPAYFGTALAVSGTLLAVGMDSDPALFSSYYGVLRPRDGVAPPPATVVAVYECKPDGETGPAGCALRATLSRQPSDPAGGEGPIRGRRDAFDPDEGDKFGFSVAATEGKRIAVGVPGVSSTSGLVYLYDCMPNATDATVWDCPEWLKLVNPEPLQPHFGYAVALAGNVLVVGAPELTTYNEMLDTYDNTGAAHVFWCTPPAAGSVEGTCNYITRLLYLGSDGRAGESVAILDHGDNHTTIVVGVAPTINSSPGTLGAVLVAHCVWPSGMCAQSELLSASSNSDSIFRYGFGYAVAVARAPVWLEDVGSHSSLVAIASPFTWLDYYEAYYISDDSLDDYPDYSGAVFILRCDPDLDDVTGEVVSVTCDVVSTVVPSSIPNSGHFGMSLALTGGDTPYLLVGSDTGQASPVAGVPRAGTVSIVSFDTSMNPTFAYHVATPSSATTPSFGSNVLMTPAGILASAPEAPVSTGPFAGTVGQVLLLPCAPNPAYDNQLLCECAEGFNLSCVQCLSGRYGPNCLPCDTCTANNGVCTDGINGGCICPHRKTGSTCATCLPEFLEPDCEQCAPGRFGAGCLSCAICNSHGGTCYEGTQGNCTCNALGYFIGALCDQCAPGLYASNSRPPLFSFDAPGVEGAPASGSWNFRWFYRDGTSSAPAASLEHPLWLDSDYDYGVTMTTLDTHRAFGLYANHTDDFGTPRSFHGFMDVVRTACLDESNCRSYYAFTLHNGGLGYLGGIDEDFGVMNGALRNNASFRFMAIRVAFGYPSQIDLFLNRDVATAGLGELPTLGDLRMRIWYSYDDITKVTKVWTTVNAPTDAKPTTLVIQHTADAFRMVMGNDPADVRNQFNVAYMGGSGDGASTNIVLAAHYTSCDPSEFQNDACFKLQCCPNFYSGENCDSCVDGYGPACVYSRAVCQQHGVVVVDTEAGTSMCSCNTGWAGPQCDSCAAGFFLVSDMNACYACAQCDGGVCSNGQCTCLPGWVGSQCSQCAANYTSAWLSLTNVGLLGQDGWSWSFNGITTDVVSLTGPGRDFILTKGESFGGGFAAAMYGDTPFNVTATPCFSAVVYGTVSDCSSDACGDGFMFALQNYGPTWIGRSGNFMGFFVSSEPLPFDYFTVEVSAYVFRKLNVRTSGVNRADVLHNVDTYLPEAMSTSDSYEADFVLWITYNCTTANSDPVTGGPGGTLSVYMNASTGAGSNANRILTRPAEPLLTLSSFEPFLPSAVSNNPLFHAGFAGGDAGARQRLQLASDSLIRFCTASEYVADALPGGVHGCPDPAPRACCPGGKTGPNCSQCSSRGYGPLCLSCQTDCEPHGACVGAGFDAVCACNSDWAGSKCDQCATTNYGPDCSLSCSVDCKLGACTTNNVTLATTCTCNENAQGVSCNVCKAGFFGDNCGYTCGNCTANGGTCIGEGMWAPRPRCLYMASGGYLSDMCRASDVIAWVCCF
jgi:hypothetical protein